MTRMRLFSLVLTLLLTLPAAAQQPVLRKMSTMVRYAALENDAQGRHQQSRMKGLHKDHSLIAFVKTRGDAARLLGDYDSHVLAQWDDICIARIPLSRLNALSASPDVLRIEASPSCKPQLDTTLYINNYAPVHEGRDLPQAYTGKGVVVGIEDIGFDLTNPNFFTADLSQNRIRRFWDQLSVDTVGSKMTVGQEYTTPEAIMAYAHSRDADTQRHGCMTLGIAAGNGFDTKWRGVAFESDICAVSNAVSADTIYIEKERRNLYTTATDALGYKYIFDYATSVGKPCVITFSEGSPYSFSDDMDLFNQVIGKMTGPGRIFVASAGNESVHGAKTYFCKMPGQERTGTFLTDSGERLLVNMLSADEFRLSLQVYNADQPVTFSKPSRDIIADEDSLIIDTVKVDATEYVIYWNAFTPTGDFDNKLVYQLYVKGPKNIGHTQPLAMVIEGTEAKVEVFRYKGDFGSHNANPDLDAGQTSHNVLMPGCSPYAICVGASAYRRGYYDADGDYHSWPYGEGGVWASYSGVGPTPEGYIKPDVVANGTNVYSSGSSYYLEAKGARGAETGFSTYNGRTYPWDADLGTSLSTPVVAGIIALWLEANPSLTPQQVMEVIAATSRHHDSDLTYPNNIYGYGEIDAYKGLLMVLQLSGIQGISDSHPREASLRVTPAGAEITFDAPVDAPLQLTAYDLQGRQQLRLTIPSGTSAYTLPAGSLPGGVYALQLGRMGSWLVRM